jgi:hypothetical protein
VKPVKAKERAESVPPPRGGLLPVAGAGLQAVPPLAWYLGAVLAKEPAAEAAAKSGQATAGESRHSVAKAIAGHN